MEPNDMKKEKFAEKLNGRQYGNEITSTEEREAKQLGLVVIFGASDDLCELRGAINDEVSCIDGGEFLIGKGGKLLKEIEDGDEDVLERHGVWGVVEAARKSAVKVEALWSAEKDYSWTYKTSVPHATFEILEDGEKYCRGIVIDLKDLK
jgi:hypothetical protein